MPLESEQSVPRSVGSSPSGLALVTPSLLDGGTGALGAEIVTVVVETDKDVGVVAHGFPARKHAAVLAGILRKASVLSAMH